MVNFTFLQIKDYGRSIRTLILYKKHFKIAELEISKNIIKKDYTTIEELLNTQKVIWKNPLIKINKK